MSDPRSDYQYLTDEEQRKQAIKEGEGIDFRDVPFATWTAFCHKDCPLPRFSWQRAVGVAKETSPESS